MRRGTTPVQRELERGLAEREVKPAIGMALARRRLIANVTRLQRARRGL